MKDPKQPARLQQQLHLCVEVGNSEKPRWNGFVPDLESVLTRCKIIKIQES